MVVELGVNGRVDLVEEGHDVHGRQLGGHPHEVLDLGEEDSDGLEVLGVHVLPLLHGFGHLARNHLVQQRVRLLLLLGQLLGLVHHGQGISASDVSKHKYK